MSSPLLIELFGKNSDFESPLLAIFFGWDSGCDASLFDACTIMEAVAGCEDVDQMELVRRIVKAIPESGIAVDPFWFDSDVSELLGIRNVCEEYGLPEGCDRNAGLVSFTPSVIKKMKAFACSTICLKFGESMTVWDFLEMTEVSELEECELGNLENPPVWMSKPIPWSNALGVWKKLDALAEWMWLCPYEPGCILQRCDY